MGVGVGVGMSVGVGVGVGVGTGGDVDTVIVTIDPRGRSSTACGDWARTVPAGTEPSSSSTIYTSKPSWARSLRAWASLVPVTLGTLTRPDETVMFTATPASSWVPSAGSWAST